MINFCSEAQLQTQLSTQYIYRQRLVLLVKSRKMLAEQAGECSAINCLKALGEISFGNVFLLDKRQ